MPCQPRYKCARCQPDGGELVIETSNCSITEEDCASYPELVLGDYIHCWKCDTGMGIGSRKPSNMYSSPFHHKGMGRGPPGSVDGIDVKRTRGHIRVSSKVGCSTGFHLYLPRTLLIEEPEPKQTPVQHFPHRQRAVAGCRRRGRTAEAGQTLPAEPGLSA